MYRALQNQSKLFYSMRSFILISLNILMYFLELNADFKHFSYVGRVLRRGVEGGGSLPHK